MHISMFVLCSIEAYFRAWTFFEDNGQNLHQIHTKSTVRYAM